MGQYDVAVIVISFWLIITTSYCIIAAHCLMGHQKTRRCLGKYLKKFVQKYTSKSRKGYSSIPESENKLNDELTLFFFIERILFPMMAAAVLSLTAVDIYFFLKYYNRSVRFDMNFNILFPLPLVGSHAVLINSFATAYTVGRLVCQNSLRCCSCTCFLTGFTIFLLFGIMYLFFHGFWLIIALLVYPGRILIGGIFVIPLILATIPTWNLLIKVIENWRSCCQRYWRSDDICCVYFYEGGCPFSMGCIWFMLLLADIAFWVLFIGTLICISRFLLGSSVNLENNPLLSLVSFIVVSAVSGILTWLSTDIGNYQNSKDNSQENQEYQESPV